MATGSMAPGDNARDDRRSGLAGSVWSRDPERAAAIAAELEVSTARMNQHRRTMTTAPLDGANECDRRHQGDMKARVISVPKWPM